MAGQRASGTYKITILNAQARSLIASSWVADEQSKFQAPVLFWRRMFRGQPVHESTRVPQLTPRARRRRREHVRHVRIRTAGAVRGG